MIHVYERAHGGQKRALEPLELGTTDGCEPPCETKFRSSGRGARDLSPQPPLQPLFLYFIVF